MKLNIMKEQDGTFFLYASISFPFLNFFYYRDEGLHQEWKDLYNIFHYFYNIQN